MSPRLHMAIREQILSLIQAGELGAEGRLPSEMELTQKFNVSRMTIREALAALELEGVLYREHGNGTFANLPLPKIVYDLSMNESISSLIERSGLVPGVSEQQIHDIAADYLISERLGVPIADNVIEVKRVRTASLRPIVVTIDVLPRQLLGTRISVELKGSIYQFIEQVLQVEVERSSTCLSIEYATEDIAKALRVPIRTPLLYVDQVDFGLNGQPVLYSREWFIKDVFQFRLERPRSKRRSSNI